MCKYLLKLWTIDYGLLTLSMELFHIFSGVLALSAILAFINVKYIRLPSGIALMLAGMILSLVVQGIGQLSPGFYNAVTESLESLDFSVFLLEFMLSFLLFAGALHTDFDRLAKARWAIISFASLGVITSTFLVGTLMYYGLILFGMPIDYIYCLLFGALISPTDPIAVLGILKKAGASKSVESKIVGESLFNDGIGVVVFLTIFQIARKGLEEIHTEYIVELLVGEILGGIGLGLLLGYLGFQLMKRIDHYTTEVMMTLAIVMGGYSIALYLHFSGPLAMVVSGLFIGNTSHRGSMSDITADYVNKFWEMLDEILNAVLFVLIGLELLIIPFSYTFVILGLIATAISLASRYTALALPTYLFKLYKTFPPNTLSIMTWGGLRGGISIALALSLDPAMEKDLIVAMTYTVVLFSLVVQGLTLERMVRRLQNKPLDA